MYCVLYGRPLRCKENVTFVALWSGAVMYPACLRGMAWPLALMKYADRLPITVTRLGGAGHNSGFPDPRLDRDRHQVTLHPRNRRRLLRVVVGQTACTIAASL